MPTLDPVAEILLYGDEAVPRDFGPEHSDGVLRYELIELLGEGTFGRVYKAIDRKMSDDNHSDRVAIKICKPLHPIADEALKARRIKHPNVVRVLDRGHSPEGEYVVFEFVPGTMDLEDHLSHSPLPVLDCASIVAKIARGVQAAHSSGVVHSDLKPANILLTGQDLEPMITDFGTTPTAGPTGTPAFMSPEQARQDESAVTPPTDIFALGGILFNLLTGKLPCDHSLPLNPSRLRPLISSDINAICARATAPEAKDRYESAGQMASDLEAWLERRPIWWRKPSLVHVLALWSKRNPLSFVVGTIAPAIIVISIVITLGVRDRAFSDADRELEYQRAETREIIGNAILGVGRLNEAIKGPPQQTTDQAKPKEKPAP